MDNATEKKTSAVRARADRTSPVRAPADDSTELNRLFKFIIQIPKTEIHLHLEGMTGPNTVHELLVKNGVKVPGIETSEDVRERFNVTNLDEFVKLFINVIQPAIKEEEDLAHLLRDARTYFKRNRIFRAEVFFAPTKFLKNGMSFEKMARALDDEARVIQAEDDIDIKFLVDVSRGFGPENAMNNLNLALAHRTESIIGIGLGGAETMGPARDFQEVFAKARAEGFRTVAHAGEDVGPESIWDAVNLLGAERIGHGISAVQDARLLEHLAQKRIPLELCPTSNVFTRKYVHELSEHPVREFFDRGLCTALNTDDPGIFWVELVDEYMNIHQECNFTVDEIIEVVQNGLEATFLPPERKRSCQEHIARSAADLRKDLGL